MTFFTSRWVDAPPQVTEVSGLPMGFRASGVACGIMDQMCAALAKPGRALLLECASLAIRHIPIGGRLLLVDTGTRRELAAGAFNQRR